MKTGVARAVFALAMLVGVVGACGRAEPATVGVGLKIVSPPTTSASTPVTVVSDAPAPPVPTPVRLPSGGRATATRRAPDPRGRIVIPRIDLDLATYVGVDEWTLRHGPSRWEVTAPPGQPGNAVFAGHRTTYTRPFYDIDLIQVGDEVTFVNATGVYTYRVTEFFVVEETDVWIAEPTETPTFTLFACHPKGSERQRYVVKGELVRAEPVGAAEPAAEPAPTRQPRKCLLCV